VDPVSHVKHPGDGFYQYVNDKWLQSNHIDPWKSENSAFAEIDKEITSKILAFLNTLPSRQPHLKSPKNAKEHIVALKHVWNSRSIPAEQIYLKLCLDEAEDIPRFFGWLSYSRIPSILNIGIQAETKSPYFVRPTLSTGGLTLPIQYYREPKLQKGPIWKAYLEFVYLCSIELGLPSLPSVIDAELELSKINTVNMNEEDIISVKGRSLNQWMPGFDWNAYMDGLQIYGWQSRTWLLDCPKRLKEILQWVCNTEKEKVISLLRYHLILQSIEYLSPILNAAADKLFRETLLGIKEEIPRKEQFLKVVKDVLPDALCSMYSSIEDDPEKLHTITLMTESIQKAAIDIMSTTTLLSEKTRSRAIEKIHRMKIYIGSGSDKDSDIMNTNSLKGLTYYPDSILQTIISIHQARFKTMLRYTGKPSAKSGPYPCFIVNASYYTESNHIVIPWGILHWPFYAKNIPFGWNHGGTGTTIAHEITHAFDLDGSLYSPRATAKEWWTRKDRRKFKERTRKVSKFYSKFTHYGLHLDGKRTISEDWADLGGIQITLKALKNDLDQMGASEDIRKETFRTFFIAYAVSWRKLQKKEKIINQILTDVHTPAIDRVDRIVPHFQEWVDAFDIKETDKLFIPKEKRLKIF